MQMPLRLALPVAACYRPEESRRLGTLSAEHSHIRLAGCNCGTPYLFECTGAKQSKTSQGSSSRQQLPQHKRQDPPMLVVVHLDGRIDAQRQAHIP